MAVDVSPTLVEEARLRNTKAQVRTTYPGVVVTYNSATGRAKVTIGQVGQTIEGIVDPPTVLPAVPVMWTKGSVGRLDPGDEIVISVACRDITRFLLSGAPLPLPSDRTHDMSDALCWPTRGISVKKPPPPDAAAYLITGREDGTATLKTLHAAPAGAPGIPGVAELEAPTIRLGVTAVENVLLGTTLGAAAEAISIAVTALAAAAGPDAAVINGLKANLIALADAIAAAPATKVFAE